MAGQEFQGRPQARVVPIWEVPTHTERLLTQFGILHQIVNAQPRVVLWIITRKRCCRQEAVQFVTALKVTDVNEDLSGRRQWCVLGGAVDFELPRDGFI